MRNPIIVALDVADAEAALALARTVAPAVGAFKIGKELFTSAGPDIVRRIREMGAAVFLDLKFHDIPNTVARAVAAATRLDVQMLTIHTSGGLEMMRAAEDAAQATARPAGREAPLVLGVTVLTSLDSNTLEIAARRQTLPAAVQLVTPGIRTGAEKADDQRRTLSPREALEAGADWLVIGRPIYAAADPRAAAERILASLGPA
jgi:orotidine-5'-phosphate decarboxylase